MPGTKVKNPAVAALPAAAATKNLAALKPGQKNDLVRRWNVKPFAVHFCLREFNVFADALRNRMAGFNIPQPFFFSRFPPF